MFAKLLLLVLPLISVSATPMPDVDNSLDARGWNHPRGWESHGCHFDCYDGMNRYLPHFAYSADNNSPQRCTRTCEAAGFKYAGLQFGKECWCGTEAGGQLADDKDCFIKCPRGKGNCGGPCRNYIWGQK